MFHGLSYGSVAAGYQADEHVADPEGRRNFRSIDHSETAACARAEVEHPPATAQTFHHGLEELLNLRDRHANGIGDLVVFIVHRMEQLSRRHVRKVLI